MSAEEERNLSPDVELLNQIIPSAGSVATSILVQTFETCTFIAQPTNSEKVVVRLEAESGRVATVSSIQKLAALAIPDLVPNVYRTGIVSASDGRNLDFSVTKYVDNAVTFEAVWDDLQIDQYSHITTQIGSAVEKLQSIDLLAEARKIPLGGPHIGFFTNMPDLVRHLVSSQDGLHQISITSTADGGLAIETPLDDIPSVSIAKDALDALQNAVVLCHSDLEPRNILVRADGADYEVVAIIDWEMAGLFPSRLNPPTKTLSWGTRIWFSHGAAAQGPELGA
ncbi:hypothetical protein BJX70DRAFT_396356 [Aspergillus crustosus]